MPESPLAGIRAHLKILTTTDHIVIRAIQKKALETGMIRVESFFWGSYYKLYARFTPADWEAEPALKGIEEAWMTLMGDKKGN